MNFGKIKNFGKQKKWWIIGILALVIILFIVFKRGDKPAIGAAGEAVTSASASGRATLTVNTTTLQEQSLPVSLQVNGTLAAWQEASIGAEVNAVRLESVNVQVGDNVQKGQVLAILDSAVAQANLQQAEAQYQEAKANAVRAQSIADSGALSQQQINQYQLQEKVTAAQLQTATVHMRNTTIVAPDDGIISARNAAAGSVVNAGQELFRLIRKGRLEWHAEVTAQELARIKVGNKVKVSTIAGEWVNGAVRTIAPSADKLTRNITVYVDLPRHPLLKAGLFAKGVFFLGTSPAYTLPAQSVISRDGFNYVFTVSDGGKVMQKKVTIGRRIGEQIEIVEGVELSDKVVKEGAGFLNDGDIVKIVEQPSA